MLRDFEPTANVRGKSCFMQDISTLKDSPDKEWIPTAGYPKEEEKKLLFQLSSESKKDRGDSTEPGHVR